jgi:hypothetical protein
MKRYFWQILMLLLVVNGVLAQNSNSGYLNFFPETKSSLKTLGFKNETNIGQHGLPLSSDDVVFTVVRDTTFKFVYSDSVLRFKEVIFPFSVFKQKDLKRSLKHLGYWPAKKLMVNPQTELNYELLFFKTEAVLRIYR